MESIPHSWVQKFDPQYREQVDALLRLLPRENVHYVGALVTFHQSDSPEEPYFILLGEMTSVIAKEVIIGCQAGIDAKDEEDRAELLRARTGR